MAPEATPPPVRLLVAAPFRRMVTVHARAAEYADEIDVCGVVPAADALMDEVRLQQPDVLVLSEELGMETAVVASRVAEVSPSTALLLMVADPQAHPEPGAGSLVELNPTALRLREAVLRAARRVLPEAPAAHAPHPAPDWLAVPEDDPSRWFWEMVQSPGAGPAGTPPATPPGMAPAGAGAAPSAPAEPAGAWPPVWPPAWLRADSGADALPEPEPEPQAPAPPEPEPEPQAPARPEPEPEAAPSEMSVGVESMVPDVSPPTESDVPCDDQVSEFATWGVRSTPAPAMSMPGPVEDAAAAGPVEDAAPPVPVEDAAPPLPADAVEAPPAPFALFSAPSAVPPHDAAAPPAQAPPTVPAAPAQTPSQPSPPEPLPPVPQVPPQVPRARRAGRTRAESILVFSGKGGVGKSVLATSLAVVLSGRGHRVALVDLDLQFGDVAVLLAVEAHPTSIESLAQQGEQVERDYLEDVMVTGPEEVRALLAPTSPEFADLVTASSIRAILRELGRAYDYIVVDAPAHLEERVLEVMESADQVLLMTSFNLTAIKDTKVTLRLLQSLGIDRDRIGVVLSQTRPRVAFSREEIERSLQFAVLAHLPHEPRIDDAVDGGRPFVLAEPRSEFSRQVRLIADHIAPEEGNAEAPPAGRVQRASRRRLFGR